MLHHPDQTPLDTTSVLSWQRPSWYVVCTSANHERKVASQLGVRGFESLLPLYDSLRRWKDRSVRIQLPLFPGYVFVRLALQNRLGVLQVPGVARFVGFNGHAAPVPEEELAWVRAYHEGGFRAEPHPFLRVGRRVSVVRGPFQGTQGILIRKKGSFRVVVSIELISRSVAIEVDSADVAPLAGSARPLRLQAQCT